jgi:hypothetical protein
MEDGDGKAVDYAAGKAIVIIAENESFRIAFRDVEIASM